MQNSPVLDRLTVASDLCEVIDGTTVRCLACAHRCPLNDGKHGACGVRFNADGELRVPFGYVAGAQVDPIEKKPFNHFLPGSQVMTFGMLGCNFHCEFCQNWLSSQALRDPAAGSTDMVGRITAADLVKAAIKNGAAAIASSYNEPLISIEWATEVFKLAKSVGMKTACVSNGFATPEALQYVRPWLDGYKIDLKSMSNKRYREMGGALQPVLDTIKLAHEMGLWVEVVTLVIPGFNDSTDELWETSRYLCSVSADIPWHVTAFHPDYRMDNRPPTTAAKLMEAAEIGQEAGLHYVYAGNLPGRVGSLEDTCCPKCNQILIKRRGYWISQNSLTAKGTCPGCGTIISGVWQ